MERWWKRLPLRDAQRIMRRHATAAEVRRIQSDRAPRTWWHTLTPARQRAIHAAEAGE